MSNTIPPKKYSNKVSIVPRDGFKPSTFHLEDGRSSSAELTGHFEIF